MNNPEHTATAMVEQDPRLMLRRVREQAAEEARTVQEFQVRHHQLLDQLLGGRMAENNDGASLMPPSPDVRGRIETGAEESRQMIDAVVKGNENMKLKEMEPGKLGENRLGAGKEGAVLSKRLFVDLDAAAKGKQAKQVAAHEAAHGDQVLGLPKKLYEGDAEIVGNTAIGEDMHYHRKGQPEALYAEGQRLAATIIRHTSHERFRDVMTKTGDIEGLMDEIDDQRVAAKIWQAISVN